MENLFSYTLLVFTSFFTLINPIGIIPIFIGLTNGFDKTQIQKTARKASLVSSLTLILFAITGQFIFRFFSISVDSLKVAGGIIFFMIGQDMLQARFAAKKEQKNHDNQYIKDIAITPLAIPIITGPGAITNAIIAMESASTLLQKGIVFGLIALIGVTIYFLLINSHRIVQIIGETGNIVLMRIMGLIVMVIAVEFFVSGLTPILRKILFLP